MSAVLPLYAIVDQLAAIEAELEERGGVADDAIEARLDALEGTLRDKIERICGWRQNLLRTSEAYTAEAARLASRAKSLSRSADSVRAYLHGQLERAGLQKLEAGLFRLAIQRNGQPSVTVSVPAAELPPQFQRVTVDADRDALLRAWRDTPEFLPPGVEVTYSNHLRIR